MRRAHPILNILLFTALFFSAGMSGCGTRNRASKSVEPARKEIPADSASQPSDTQPVAVAEPPEERMQEPDSIAALPPQEQTAAEPPVAPAVEVVAEDSAAMDEIPEPEQATDTLAAPAAAETATPTDEPAAPAPEAPADSTTAAADIPAYTAAQAPQIPADSSSTQSPAASEGPENVDFTADIMRPVQVGDSTAISLVGNVIFHHNGAVITCDSAIRYSNTRMECFQRVVINQDSTYVYGDRADYNGEINTANVYAPIIKVVDGDAVLYTYVFTFNTLDNIGRYGGGGTMSQKDNQMESDRGYYFVDRREFVGVDHVELRNPEYRMVSDSVAYNLNTEVARFFSPSTIWNEKGEILSADKGFYNSSTGDYEFRSNAYVITETREIWSDTLDYNSRTENAVMRSNIQMRDDDEHVMAFGDFGQWWGEPQNGVLTEEPSLLSFDPEQPDTLYMRSDTMLLNTYPRDMVFDTGMQDEGDASPGEQEEEVVITSPDASSPPPLPAGEDVPDSAAMAAVPEAADSLAAQVSAPEEGDMPADSLATEPPEEISPKQAEKNERREAKRLEREQKRQARLDALADILEDHDHNHDHDMAEAADSTAADSMVVEDIAADSLLADSLAAAQAVVPAAGEMPPANSLAAAEEEQDSLQRVFRALRNVRIFREDLQAVCDSLIGFSRDSTMYLYKDPVLWSDSNQMKSDKIAVFTSNQQLVRAEFIDNPFMSSRVDDQRFNQVKGRQMTAWFRDNEIYRHDVNGNTQTYYYMQDEDTGDPTDFSVVESADASFYIDQRQIEEIIYRSDPVYTIYPLDKIPAEQELLLPGFVWEEQRRPKNKEEVFRRTIRPSQREEYESRPQPLFPLTEGITAAREKMIRDGVWRERNDVLTPQTIEYVRSLSIE